MREFTDNLKIAIFAIILILIGQWVSTQHLEPLPAIPGAIEMCVIVMAALYVKKFLRYKRGGIWKELPVPAFAWAIIISLLLTYPFTSFNVQVNDSLNKISFMATTTPLLAFAGISVGNQLGQLKAMSWRIVIVAMITFFCVYFGAETILRFTHVI